MDLLPPQERRFSSVTEEKASGASYTPAALARFVAEQIAIRLPSPGTGRILRILDPSAGDGALLHAMAEVLYASGRTEFELHAVEQNREAASETERRLRHDFPGVRVEVECRDFLTTQPHQHRSPLFAKRGPQPFDVVIANPPYVRTQVLGAETAQDLSRRFGLHGRVDLYHAFLLAIPESLAEAGIAGIIVSNRFLTTKGGATLRTLLPRRLALQHLWDLGDTKLFEDAVLPAVIIAGGTSATPSDSVQTCKFSSIYTDKDKHSSRSAPDPISALIGPAGTVSLPDNRQFCVRHGVLDMGSEPGSVWRISEGRGDAWLQQVLAGTWRTFGQIGKIRVGVKTTADSVFIRDDWDTLGAGSEPELLRPLTTHHIGARYRAASPKRPKLILYPHLEEAGRRQVADLRNYPKSAAYLEQHRAALSARTYVAKAGRQWYEVWVPQSPLLWPKPKLVFRDISDRPMFWIDETGSVINGDCYWMVPDETATPYSGESLLRLCVAVGNSTFIEHFYDHMFNNKLYAGRRRYISQYVEKFPVPHPETPAAREIVRLVDIILKRGVSTTDEESALDALVWTAFGLPAKH